MVNMLPNNPQKPKDVLNKNGNKSPQFIAATSASFAAFSTGTILGWTSQISPQLLNGEYGFPINENQLGWIGSLTSLGAAFLCLFIGPLCDLIGRKPTKLLMVIPLILGWGLIAWAENVEMLYVGRFLTGMIGGASLVTAPLYCSEISENKIRGTLGCLTQLMISFGLFFDVIIGKYADIKTYTLCCFGVPFVFIAFFIFMPETPVYYLKKNNVEEARKVLLKLRGNNYDIETEIIEIKQSLDLSRGNNFIQTIKDASTRSSTRKAFLITFGLMSFRFLCGVDSITAFTSYIFLNANENFDPEIGPIILVAIQVIFGVIQSSVVDKIGRRILLLPSQIAIAISLTAVAVGFLLKNQNLVDETALEIINFIPLIALGVFYVGFAMGLAPIPLMLNAEINPQETKSLVSSFNNCWGWLLAFAITKSFLPIQEGIGPEGAFFIYAGFTFLGALFIWVFVPETKGKSNEEIQAILIKR
ncbi:facilitated trehalose transporter Tret1-like [Onthophagus taurus]|uniref:facilitated trehalose transporter Tret1-like n=1 Tax=Onthophagus taurus TaxID=166361 RepID=UPI0039BDBFDD